MLTWLSGSTYSVEPAQALRTALVAAGLMVLAPLCRRWLTILPLGGATARSVGIALTPARLTILLLAAVLTAMATLTVGPLSFVGLMAPHMARMLGFRRALPQMVIAALLGGLLMVFADWCGRMLLFPYQIPLGYWRPLSVRRTSFICCVSDVVIGISAVLFCPQRLSVAEPFFFQGVASAIAQNDIACEKEHETWW